VGLWTVNVGLFPNNQQLIQELYDQFVIRADVQLLSCAFVGPVSAGGKRVGALDKSSKGHWFKIQKYK
jgi:hypothetical protein